MKMKPQILWESYKRGAVRYLCGPSYESSKLKQPKKRRSSRNPFAFDKNALWPKAKKKKKAKTRVASNENNMSTHVMDNDETLPNTDIDGMYGPITVEINNFPHCDYPKSFNHNDTIAEVQKSIASIFKLDAESLELRYNGRQLDSEMKLKLIAPGNPIKLYLNARKLPGQENDKSYAQHLSLDVQDKGRNPILDIKEVNGQISVVVNTSKLSSTSFKRVELKHTWTFQLQPAKNCSNMWSLSSKDGRGQTLLLNLKRTDNGLETLVAKGKLPHMHLSLRADDIKITGQLHLGGELNLISKYIRIDNALSSHFILVRACEKCTVGTEGLLDTSFINIDAKTCIIDGAIFNNRFGKRFLSIITSGDLRTGIHAKVGYKIDAKESVKMRGKRKDPFEEETLNIGLHQKRKESYTVKSIFLVIKGNFTNFGTIRIGTNGYIECESIKSTLECTEDTARNGYKAHKMIKRLPECDSQQSITKDLINAVRETKVRDIPTLIEAGHNQTCVTKAKGVANDIFSRKVLRKNKAQTPIDISERHKHYTGADLENFEEVATVVGFLNWWHFKRGHIYGRKLNLRVKKDIEDLSQILVDSLSLHIDGDIYVQENTHWVSGKVTGIVQGTLFTFGTMKLSYIDNLLIRKDWLVKNNVAISHGGCIRCDGALTNNSCITVENNTCKLKVGSFSQAEHAKLLGDVAKKVAIFICISKDCRHILGEWNSNAIILRVSAHVMLGVNIKTDSCLSMYIIDKRGICLEMLGSVEVLNGPIKGYCIATSNIQKMSQELKIAIKKCNKNANIILKGHLQSCGIIALGVRLLIQDKGLVQQNKCLCVPKCASIRFGAITSECETEIIISDCDFRIGVDGMWHHRGTVTLNSDSCFNTTSIFGNTIINDGIWRNLGVLKVTAASKFQNNLPLKTDGTIVLQGNGLIENNAQISTSGSMLIDMFHAAGSPGSGGKQVEYVLKLEFHNNSPLEAKGNIVLQGVDFLQNNAYMITYGDMKINKCLNKECINKCEIQNNSGLIAHHGLELIADKIVNHEKAGLIMSLLKSVYLRLDSTDEIVLEGLLNTLMGLKIDVPKSGSFTFKCRGGYVICDQRMIPVGGFALPKLGMNVNCFQGNIHCQKQLISCEPETQLSILAQHLLEFSQNVRVPEVYIHLPSKIKENSDTFVLRFDGASLVTNEICITTESNTVDLKVETPKLGKITFSNILEASSVNLMLEGTFDGEPDCEIVARDLLILKGSEIKFEASQNRSGTDCTAQVDVQNNFSTDGLIESEHEINISSREGYIAMQRNSKTAAQNLALKTCKKTIKSYGNIQVRGDLVFIETVVSTLAQSSATYCVNLIAAALNSGEEATDGALVIPYGSVQIYGRLTLHTSSQVLSHELIVAESGSIELLPLPVESQTEAKRNQQAVFNVNGKFCTGGYISSREIFTMTINSEQDDIIMKQTSRVHVHQLVARCSPKQQVLFDGEMHIDASLCILDSNSIELAESNSMQCANIEVRYENLNKDLLTKKIMNMKGSAKVLENIIATECDVLLSGNTEILTTSVIFCKTFTLQKTGCLVLSKMRFGNSAQLQSCHGHFDDGNEKEAEVTDANLQLAKINVKGRFCTEGKITSSEVFTMLIDSEENDIIMKQTSCVHVHKLVARCSPKQQVLFDGEMHIDANLDILDAHSIVFAENSRMQCSTIEVGFDNAEIRAVGPRKITINGSAKILKNMAASEWEVKIDGHLFISGKSNISCYALSIAEIGCLTLQPQEMGSDSSYPRCILMVNDDFSNWGKLVSCEKSNTTFQIHTKNGKVNFWETSSTSLSNLSIFSRTNISINGELQINDKFQATNACKLHIGRSCKLTCENFSVPLLSSKNEAEIVLQNFEIMGKLHAKRVEVTVASFKLADSGHLLIDGDNRSYILVQEGGMTLSGNIDNIGNVDPKSEPTQNGFFLKAKRCIECIGMTAFLNNKGMRLTSDERITLDEQCRINLSSSFLIIDTSTKTDCDVNISGQIFGSFIYKAKESLDTETRDVAQYNPDDPQQLPWFEVTGHNVTFRKLKLAKIAHTQIKAEYKFVLDELSEICQQNTMNLEADVLLLHGKIQSVVEILTIEPWNFHVTGSIEDIGILKILAELFALNNGVMSASRIEIFSPVLMNIWQPKGNDNVKALIEGTCLLRIEGLVCLYVGSIKHAKSHQIRAGLSFEFDGEITTKRPSTAQLNQWRSAIDSGLRPAAELQSKHDEFGSFINDSIKTFPQMACSLSATNHLCTRVMALSENLKSNGVHKFNLNDLCEAFETAHTQYYRIKSFETFRINLRKLKGRAKCCLKDIFGEDYWLDIKQTKLDTVVEEGIEAITFMSYADSNSNVSTGGNYVADARVWINKGNIVAGVDLSVRSGRIVHGDMSGRRQLRALRAITLSATNDIRANNLSCFDLSATAAGDIEINSTTTDKFQVQTKGNARVEDLNTKTAQIDAHNVNLTNGTIAENAEITGNKDVSVDNLDVAGKMTLEAKQGKASMVDKVKASTVELIGGQGGATIVGKNGANHEIGTLQVRNAKWSNEDLKLILSAKGAYESLQIKDKLDLCIPDQNVLLANMVANISYGLDIEAKTLNLQSANINSERSVKLKATELQNIEKSDVHGRNVDVSSDGNIKVDSSNITSSGNTKLEAGKDISIKAGSHKSTIKGDTSVTIKAKRNIDIESSIIKSSGDNTLSAGGNLTLKEKHKEYCTDRKMSRFFGLITEEKKVYQTVVMPAEVISSGGKNMITAGGNISSVATNFESAQGNVVQAQGYVDMRNYVANTRTETTTSFLGGLLGGRKQTAEHETNYGTMLRDNSENAKTIVMSRTKDVTFHGSGIKSAGKVSIASDKGNIVFTEQKLNKKSISDELGIDPSKVLRGNIQLKARTSNEMSQSISNTGLQAKCLDISAGNALIVKEGFDIDVANNMSCNVRNINIEGATCMSSAKSHDVSFSVDPIGTTLRYEYAMTASKATKNSRIKVGGAFVMGNIEKLTIRGGNVETNEIRGRFDQMHVESLQDKMKSCQLGMGVERGFNGTITPSLDMHVVDSKQVKCTSGINVKKRGTENLQGKNLYMKGAMLNFNGEVSDFVENVGVENIRDAHTELNFGMSWNIRNLKKLAVQRSMATFGHDLNVEENVSTITSRTGKVDKKISQKINTDEASAKKSIMSCKIDTITIQTPSIKKTVVKISTAAGMKVAKELGIDSDVRDLISLLVDHKGKGQDIVMSIVKISGKNLRFEAEILNVVVVIVEGVLAQTLSADSVIDLVAVLAKQCGIQIKIVSSFANAAKALSGHGNPRAAIFKCLQDLAISAGIENRIVEAFVAMVDELEKGNDGAQSIVKLVIQVVKHAGIVEDRELLCQFEKLFFSPRDVTPTLIEVGCYIVSKMDSDSNVVTTVSSAGIMDSVAILMDNKSTVEMKISAAIIATAHLLQKLGFGPEVTDVLVSTAAIMKSSENRAKELINLVRLHLRFVKGDNEVISFACEIQPVISSGEDWQTVAFNLISIVAETIGIENMFIARAFDTLKKVLVEDDKIKCIIEFLYFLAQEAGIDGDITNIICSFFDATNDGEKLCLGVFQALGRKLDINSECLFIITSLVRDMQQGESKNKVIANLIKRLSKHYCLRPELAEIVELVVQALLGEESLEQTMLSMVHVATRTLCPGSFIGEAITSFMKEQSIIQLASKIAENAGIDRRVIDILVENASALLECGNKLEIAKHISSSLAMFANIEPSITSCIVSFAIASAQGKQITDEVICFLKTISNKIGIESDLATALAKLTHSSELPAVYDLLCILTKNMTMNSKIKDALVGIIHTFLSHDDISHEVENLVSLTLQLCKFDIKDTTEVTAAIVSLFRSHDSLSEVAVDFEVIAESTADSDLQNLLVLLKCATYENGNKTWIATQILQIIGGKAGFEECCIETIATTLSLLMSSKDKMKTASEVVILFASNYIPNSQVVNVITVVLKAVDQGWTNPNAKIEMICHLALNIGITKDLVEAVSCLLQSKTLDKNAFAHILEILLTKTNMSEKHVKTISSAVLSIASSNSFSDCLQRLIPSLCELLGYDPMIARVIKSVMDHVIQSKPVMETATLVADVILTKAGIAEENINTFNSALLMLQNTDKKLPAIINLISMLIKTNCEGLHTESLIEVIIREFVAGKDWRQVIITTSAKMMRILELGEDVEREITRALSLYETDKTQCILGFLSMLAKRINIQPEIAETVGVNQTALRLLQTTIQSIQSGEDKIKMLRNIVVSVFMQIGMNECDVEVFSSLFDSVLNGELNAEAVINVIELFAKKLFQDSKPMKHAFVLLRSIALKQGTSSVFASLVDVIAALAEDMDIDKCIIEVCSSMAKCFIYGGDKRQAVMKTVLVFAEKINIDPEPVLAVASFIDSVRAGHNMKNAATELLRTICKHINISEDIYEIAINMLIVVLNGGTVAEAVIEMVTTLAKRIGIDSNLVDNIVETFQSLQTGNDQVETSLELMALFARKAGLDADIVDAMVVLIKAIANKQGVDEAASDLHLLLVDKLK